MTKEERIAIIDNAISLMLSDHDHDFYGYLYYFMCNALSANLGYVIDVDYEVSQQYVEETFPEFLSIPHTVNRDGEWELVTIGDTTISLEGDFESIEIRRKRVKILEYLKTILKD